MADLVDHLGLHAIEKADEDSFAGLPNDDENRRGDDKAHNGVSERVAQPHAPGSEKDSKAGPTVRSRMVAVCDQGGAAYLPAHPDAKDGDGFVADKADQRSGRLLRQEGLRIYKRYLDDFLYRELANVWTDTWGEDDAVYVVQTDTRVVERCILMTTDPGDLVLDPT